MIWKIKLYFYYRLCWLIRKERKYGYRKISIWHCGGLPWMADIADVTVGYGVVDMDTLDTLTKRAEALIQAYEQICKANKTIMKNCFGKCRNCPISDICDNEWIIYDEKKFKEVEPWADFIDRADRHERKLAEQNEDNVAWYEYLD